MSEPSPAHPLSAETQIPTLESLPVDQQAALHELNQTYKTIFASNYHTMMAEALCTDGVINIKTIKSVFGVVKKRDLAAYNTQGIGALYVKLASVGVFSIKGGYVKFVDDAMDTDSTPSVSRKRPAEEKVKEVLVAKKLAVEPPKRPIPEDSDKVSLVDAIITALQHQRSRPGHTPHVAMMIE